MLSLKDIHTYYGNSHILQGINLEIPKKSAVALLGRNGMGKTTTIHSIMGLTPPKKGQITFRGMNILNLQPFQIAKLGIALIPQGRRIFNSLTVKENLAIAQRKVSSGKYNLESIFYLFPILKEKSKQYGGHLSGGQQQMLAIARALLTNPECILMDEPFEGLAPTIVKDISQKILELKKSGLSILLVEQNIEVALRIADYVYIINKGKITYEKPVGQIKNIEEVKQNIFSF
jgi:branched-chain amino acid transport system ATP-binding protein